jgi:hypothetical protein
MHSVLADLLVYPLVLDTKIAKSDITTSLYFYLHAGQPFTTSMKDPLTHPLEADK